MNSSLQLLVQCSIINVQSCKPSTSFAPCCSVPCSAFYEHVCQLTAGLLGAVAGFFLKTESISMSLFQSIIASWGLFAVWSLHFPKMVYEMRKSQRQANSNKQAKGLNCFRWWDNIYLRFLAWGKTIMSEYNTGRADLEWWQLCA